MPRYKRLVITDKTTPPDIFNFLSSLNVGDEVITNHDVRNGSKLRGPVTEVPTAPTGVMRIAPKPNSYTSNSLWNLSDEHRWAVGEYVTVVKPVEGSCSKPKCKEVHKKYNELINNLKAI